MSLARPILNLWLNLFEKRFLAQAGDPVATRIGFERKARFWFWPPRGTEFETGELRPGDGAPVPVLWVRARGAGRQAVILHFHGGAYFMGSPVTHRAMLAQLSALSGIPACLPDYSLAPEHPFPAAYDDAMTAYRGLLAQGWPSSQIILGGDSAGGGLALALLAGICREGLPKPLMTYAFSPLTDLTFSGASLRDNRATEVMLPDSRLLDMPELYLQGADPKDPRASPLFAEFPGASRVLLIASRSEILLDDSREMAASLRRQAVPVETWLEPGLPHVWPMFHSLLPEARRTLKALAKRLLVAVAGHDQSDFRKV